MPNKKLPSLQEEIMVKDGLVKNPNKCIFNVTEVDFSKEQYRALQYGLKYGLAVYLKEESLWEQLEITTKHNVQRTAYMV